MAEGVLQEKQIYSQILSDCVTIGGTLSTAGLTQDLFAIELKKEEQMTKHSRELLQNQISTLEGNLRSDNCSLRL